MKISRKSPLLSLSSAGLFLVLWVLIGIVLLLELSRDNEVGAARFFGMEQDAWGAIYLMLAIPVAARALLHLVQNWASIRAAVSRIKPKAPQRL